MNYKYLIAGVCTTGAAYGLYRMCNSISFYLKELELAKQKRNDEIKEKRERMILILKTSAGTLLAGLSFLTMYKLKTVVYNMFYS